MTAVEDQSKRAVWIRCRVEGCHRRTLRNAQDYGALRAGGVHHGADVVGSLLERGDLLDAVGEPGAALVEEDQAGERGDAVACIREPRVLPEQLDVRDRAG